MSLEKEGLMLGAGTVLAKRNFDGALALNGNEARLLTLLAVAYGRPVKPSVLGTIAKASKHARAGDESMAAMLIALAGLPKIDDSADSARRMFIADGLMKDGVSPRDIWTALDFDSTALDELEKGYNPNEPRVPAKSGRTSGQWTSGYTTADGNVPAAVVARAVAEAVRQDATQAAVAVAETGAARWWQMLLRLGARAAGPLAFVSALLYSTPAGGARRSGRVPGEPDLFWTDDEGLLTITQEPGGHVVLQGKRDANGNFRVTITRAFRRLENEHSQVDADLLAPADPRSSQRDEPKSCPEPPGPDKKGSESNAYANFMKPIVNQPPTPPELGYQLLNPYQEEDTVYYDDCERASGTMIEYKGTTYAKLLVGKSSFAQVRESINMEWLSEATRQIEASRGRPVRWYFAEAPALEYARHLFNDDKNYAILRRIDLVYAPYPRSNQ
jgi:hypothetical protein